MTKSQKNSPSKSLCVGGLRWRTGLPDMQAGPVWPLTASHW